MARRRRSPKRNENIRRPESLWGPPEHIVISEEEQEELERMYLAGTRPPTEEEEEWSRQMMERFRDTSLAEAFMPKALRTWADGIEQGAIDPHELLRVLILDQVAAEEGRPVRSRRSEKLKEYYNMWLERYQNSRCEHDKCPSCGQEWPD